MPATNITKTERTELRGIVKQQFSVLKAELEQRRAELIAEAELTIVDRYDARDRQREAVEARVAEVVENANRQLREVLEAERIDPDVDLVDPYLGRGRAEVPVINPPRLVWHEADKVQRHRALVAKIDADVEAAKLRLKRQEADLLRTLAVGALEGDEARGFLTSIPSVGELVPAARLAELEAAIDEDEGS